jgi:hypothetical protein
MWKNSANTQGFAPLTRPIKTCLGVGATVASLAFFDPRIAPPLACHLLAGKQGASAPCVTGFALVRRAVCAQLTSSIFRELLGVSFGGICKVSESNRLWILFRLIWLGFFLRPWTALTHPQR